MSDATEGSAARPYWFSALLNFVLAIDGDHEVKRSRSVIVFQAPQQDFDAARRKAIDLGLAQEQRYENVEGKQVSWTLQNVETIDELGGELVDGREVYHEFSEPILREDLGGPLVPTDSDPGPSGV